MYCHAHKTATLTPIQHTVPPPMPQVPTTLFEFIGITLGGLFHLLWVFYFFAAVVCNGMYTGQKELDFQ